MCAKGSATTVRYPLGSSDPARISRIQRNPRGSSSFNPAATKPSSLGAPKRHTHTLLSAPVSPFAHLFASGIFLWKATGAPGSRTFDQFQPKLVARAMALQIREDRQKRSPPVSSLAQPPNWNEPIRLEPYRRLEPTQRSFRAGLTNLPLSRQATNRARNENSRALEVNEQDGSAQAGSRSAGQVRFVAAHPLRTRLPPPLRNHL